MRQAGKVSGDERGSAGNFARSYGKDGAGIELDAFAVFEAAGANLRALKVLEDADRALEIVGGAPQTFDPAGVFGVGSVGEIEACDVHTGEHKRTNHLVGVAGGADGANDFCAARGRGCVDQQRNGGREVCFNDIGLALFQVLPLSRK